MSYSSCLPKSTVSGFLSRLSAGLLSLGFSLSSPFGLAPASAGFFPCLRAGGPSSVFFSCNKDNYN
ncbi:hypothetical protein MOQ_006909 [Trypanosoma cruzi marinkellei]|uniref:Uncharacterized protein n=1 Tax=Trypanosoma cruzi marinkellei TaxID=85056 RepID=K2MUA7_TRYCR|nr:hypothetical protein MOQ_006909 [Trypanosoma cruzi marinkellei]